MLADVLVQRRRGGLHRHPVHRDGDGVEGAEAVVVVIDERHRFLRHQRIVIVEHREAQRLRIGERRDNRSPGEGEGQAVGRLGEELLDQPVAILRGDLGVQPGGVALRDLERLELVAQLIDGDDRVERRRVGVAGVVDADQLGFGGAAGNREDGAAAVAGVEQGVDDEVRMVPAALGVDGHGIENFSGVERGESAEREAAHPDEVARAQRRRAAEAPGRDAELLLRLEHRDVRRRIGEQLGERHVAGLVVVVFVVDDLELFANFFGAHRHGFHRVVVVGDVGLAGDVLVGDDLGLAVDDAIAEAGAVDGGAQVGAAQLAVVAVVDVLVGGGVADGEDERVLGGFENRVGLLDRQHVGVVSAAERRRGRLRDSGSGRRLRPGLPLQVPRRDRLRDDERGPQPCHGTSPHKISDAANRASETAHALPPAVRRSIVSGPCHHGSASSPQ